MKKKLYLFAVIFFFGQTIFAQQFNSPTAESSTGFSGTGANINVVYHRIDWTIDPRAASNTITGTVVTYFKTTVANVSSISLDLHSNFNNGSLLIKYHGITCANSFSGKIVTITLPSTIVAVNTLDSLVVNYSGVPPVASGAAQGYQRSGASPNQYTGSLAESYEDRDWWPCKADMQDKIDSMDINVTVPWIVNANGDTFWVATNGVLYDSTIGAGTRTFKFKTRYPIASYLVSLAVAKFNRYYRTVNINGTNTPVVYYILRNTASQPAKVAAMDQMNLVITAFSSKFGDYPFKLEKHGYYDGLVGAGGMEHQTFSAIQTTALADLKTLAHELMHQWFGDNVSFSTWNDLWLAEGFARYSESLCGELVPSLGLNPYTIRNGFKTTALGLNAASAWIPNANIANSDLIWNSSYGSTVYERGCMVVSMLRAMSGDTKFFQALTNYQTNRAGKSATADTLKNYFNAVLGVDISEFFKDYVGGSGSGTTAVGGVGNPINTVNWNNPSGTKKLVIQMGTQSRTPGSNVTYFNGPVVIHATNAASGWSKDTTIVFYDWGGLLLSYAGNGITAPNSNFLSYDLSFTPTNLFYDDSARTLSTGSTNKLTTLATNVIDFSARKISVGNQVNLSITNSEPVEKVILLKSENGTDFTDAGLMIKMNTSGTVINYQFNDVVPFSPVTFYKAKIIHTAGQDEYSGIVKVQQSVKKDLVLSPNPADDNIYISFSNNDKVNATVRVANADGKTVIESSTKNDFIHFDVRNLPVGIYLVQVIKPGEVTETNKFMIRH